MANFMTKPSGQSKRKVESDGHAADQDAENDAATLAKEQQNLITDRLSSPVDNDPLHRFDSSMNSEQVREQFATLVRKIRRPQPA